MNSTIQKISAVIAPYLGQNSRLIESLIRQGLTYLGALAIAYAGHHAHALSVLGLSMADVTSVVAGAGGSIMTAVGVWLTTKANTPAAIQASANQNLVVAQATVASPTATPAVAAVAQMLIDNHVGMAVALKTDGSTRVPFPVAQAGTTTGAAAQAAKVLPLLLCALLLNGCSTLNNAAAKVTPAQVAEAVSLVRQTTHDAVASLMLHHPNFASDLRLADVALNAFVAGGGTDPVQLRAAIVAVIPVADQADALPVVDIVVGAYSAYVTPWLTTETSGAFATDAKALLGAVDDGLNAVINAPKP